MHAALTVIRSVYKDNFLKNMRDERGIQRERLHENVQQMTSLERSVEEQRIRVEKLVTVYGLDRTLGGGGIYIPFHHGGIGTQGGLRDAQQPEECLAQRTPRLPQQLPAVRES